jgi:hypothetical protein
VSARTDHVGYANIAPVEPSCPLCSAALTGVDYAEHLRDVHGLVDDPGTTSADREPAPPVVEAPANPSEFLASTPGPDTMPYLPATVHLLEGESVLEVFEGSGPPPRAIGGRSKSKAVVVGGVLGGAIGAGVGAVWSTGGSDKFRGRLERRSFMLTNQRVLYLEHHIVRQEAPLSAVTSPMLRFVGPDRRGVSLRLNHGRRLRVEGARSDAVDFLAALSGQAGIAVAGVRTGYRPPRYVPRLILAIVLYALAFLSGYSVLVALVLGNGFSAIVNLVVAGIFLAFAERTRRRWLR